MPGQSDVKPRPTSCMSSTSTLSMSPALAPATSIGPVAPLTKGSVTSVGFSCWPSRLDHPVIDVDGAFDGELLARLHLGDERRRPPTARI